MNEEDQVCMNKKTVKEIVNTFVTMTYILESMQYLITTFHNESIGEEVKDINRKMIELNQQIQRELIANRGMTLARKVRAATTGIRAQSHTDRIAEVIGEEWLAKTEIYKAFSNNLSAEVLNASLEQLLSDEVIEEEKVPTQGAPLYRYRKVTKEGVK
jgi:uncharacterized protein with PhoU and TrkA domain